MSITATALARPRTVPSMRAMGARGTWTCWAITRALCLLVVMASLHVPSRSPIFGLAGDVPDVYAVAAHHIHAGLVPYRNFHFEYPPGTLPFLLPWPRLDSTDYLLAYASQMLVVDALILRALRRSGTSSSSDAALLWVFGVALTLGLPLSRNDLPSCLAVVVGLLMYVKGRRLLGAVALSLGTVAKVWPGMLLALATAVVPRAWRSSLTAAAGVGAVALAPLVCLGAASGLWRDVVGYHSGRGVEVEATAALPALLWGAVDGRGAHLSGDHGSTNLAHSTALGSVCTVVGVLFVLAVLAVGLRLRRQLGRVAARELTGLACVLVTGSLLAAKVFSAQYIVWLLAVACVGRVHGSVDRMECRIVLGAVLATTLVYPLNFFLIGDPGLTAGMAPAAVLLARDIALVVLVARWTRRLLAVAR